MFNILIVDDEAIIRKGLKTSIDWDSINVKIEDEAKNGVEALSIIQQKQVDIVITDVRMPVMDGLNLSKEIMKKYPEIKIIIISGYDDFEYAREALKYGVCEYLLKPVSIEELTDTVKSLCQQIVLEKNEAYEKILSKSLIKENLPYIRSVFFNKIPEIFQKNDSNVNDKAKRLGFFINEQNCKIALFDIDDCYILSEELKSSDIYEIKMSIMNIVEEILGEVYTCTLFYNNLDYIFCIIYANDNHYYCINDIFQEIQFCIKKHLKLTVTIGLGKTCKSIMKIKESYQQAYKALKSKAYLGKDKIIHYENVEKKLPKEDVWLMEDIKSVSKDTVNLIDAIFRLDIECTNHVLNQILSILLERNTNFVYVKHEVLKIISVVIFNIEKSGIQVEDRYNNITNLYDEMKRYETIEDLERWIKRIIHTFFKVVDKNMNSRYKNIIKKALDFVNEHYKESIMIEDIASKLYITPNYFSRVFKEEVGETFVTWLNRFRVEKAKQLLKDNKLKIYEVAEEVGFNDYRYFNKVFKRYSGYSPIEYKKNQ